MSCCRVSHVIRWEHGTPGQANLKFMSIFYYDVLVLCFFIMTIQENDEPEYVNE